MIYVNLKWQITLNVKCWKIMSSGFYDFDGKCATFLQEVGMYWDRENFFTSQSCFYQSFDTYTQITCQNFKWQKMQQQKMAKLGLIGKFNQI